MLYWGFMAKGKKKRIMSLEGVDPLRLLGARDRNIRLIEDHYDEKVVARGERIIVEASPENLEEITAVLERLIRMAGSGRTVTEGDVLSAIRGGVEEGGSGESPGREVVFHSRSKRKGIAPRSAKQREYVDKIRKYDVVFAIGPAGTGKTYLAIAMALAALKSKQVERIFISRPVVEAGENLGFLPGDQQEKIDPYLRPIFDAMRDMVGRETMQRMMESGTVEITPLAYMRGRTLNNCFAVLDEAQNSTIMQMKMFLTRLGSNAKAVITGDITQIDLSDPGGSGLVAVREILEGIDGIEFVTFGEEDVVRHRLVKRIIRAFSTMNQKSRKAAETRTPAEGGSEEEPSGMELEDE